MDGLIIADVPVELSTLSSGAAATALSSATAFNTAEHDGSRGIFTTTFINNSTTTTDIYDNKYISPPSFLGILNIIAGSAILINLPHLILISQMNVGSWTAARNFKHFVIFLAFTDLFLSVGRLCLDNAFVQEWMYDNHWFCVTTATILPSLNVFQTTLLALASIERYIAASAGLKYSTKLFIKGFTIIMSLTLLFWLVLYTVFAALFHDIAYSLQGASECQISSKTHPYFDLVSGLAGGLNLIAIIVCYLMLLCKTRKISKAANIRPVISRRAAKLNRTVGVLVVTKVLLWLPIILFVILRTFQIRSTELIRVGSCCIYLCSIANPILYGVTSSKYRRHLRAKLLCQKTKTDFSTTTGTSRDRSSNQPALSVSDSSMIQPPLQQILPPTLPPARVSGRPIL